MVGGWVIGVCYSILLYMYVCYKYSLVTIYVILGNLFSLTVPQFSPL